MIGFGYAAAYPRSRALGFLGSRKLPHLLRVPRREKCSNVTRLSEVKCLLDKVLIILCVGTVLRQRSRCKVPAGKSRYTHLICLRIIYTCLAIWELLSRIKAVLRLPVTATASS